MNLVFQSLGGTFFIVAAQAAFINKLVSELPHTAPDVDPAAVVVAGATHLRAVFDEDQVPGILLAYMSGLKVTFAIAIGSLGLTFLLSLFNPLQRLNTITTREAVVAA